MISQKVKTIVSNTNIEFGKGDVAIRLYTNKKDPNIVTIGLSNITPVKVGEKVNEDVSSMPVVMKFDLESLKVMRSVVEKAIEKLENEKQEVPKFKVKTCSLNVPNHSFEGANVEDVIEWFKDTKVVIGKRMFITSGYAGYIEAKNAGKETIEVEAPKGIDVLVGGKIMNFKTNKIHLDIEYHLSSNDNRSYVFIIKDENDNEIGTVLAPSICKAALEVKKISDTFVSDFTINSRGSCLKSKTLCHMLENLGITACHE